MGSREGPPPAPVYGPLLDALPHAVLIVDHDGDIIEANDTALDMFGLDRSELVGGSIGLLIPDVPQRAERVTDLARLCRRGDGERFSADVTLGPVATQDGALLVVSVREASEQRRADSDKLQRLAVVAERDRIGRELHDGTIQALFSVGISLQGSEVLTDDPVLLARLESGVAQIDAVIGDLRNYVFGLRPGGLTRRPLDEALYELADRFQLAHGVSTTVDVDGGLAAELTDVAADLLQLTREAVANVAKHAGARNCAITLRRSGDHALLEVEDDGAGFVREAAGDRGWGLRNIEERASAVGGRIEIRTAMSAGTTIRLLIPR